MNSRSISRIIFTSNGDPPYNGCGLIPKRASTVRFVLTAGSTLYTKNPRLFSNYPLHGGTFDRDTWAEVPNPGNHTGEFDWYIDIVLDIPGAFEYYLAWTDRTHLKKGKVGHFVVNPVLSIRDKPLDIACLSIQTVLTKNLGSFDRWEELIRQAAHAGYNMMHFTHIQELGSSQSGYSLYSQDIISSRIFPKLNLTEPEKFNQLSTLFKKAEYSYGVLTLGDLVLNHTTNNSPWLEDHPEATYNPETAPHLKPAVDFDLALDNLTTELLAGRYLSSHNLQQVRTEDDLNMLRKVLWSMIESLRLWEYFVVDVDQAVAEFTAALRKKHQPAKSYAYIFTGTTSNQNLAKFINFPDFFQKEEAMIQSLMKAEGLKVENNMGRFCHSVDINFAVAVFGFGYQLGVIGLEEARRFLRKQLELYNLPKYEELKRDMESAVEALIGGVRHEIVSKQATFSKSKPLFSHYFNPIQRKRDGKTITYAACNGWIWGGSPTEDFAGPNSKAYLRRELIAWGDTIKLRFGKGPEDSPWLWAHMKKYTEETARLFNGVRLDNCHSTPLHVARYLIDAARKARPEIYVIAELFTGSSDLDRLYISELGINSLIREAMQVPDPHEMSRLCFLYGGQPVGSVVGYYSPQYYDPSNTHATNERDLPILSLTEPPALFFDCTHDNEVPPEKRHPADSLSNAALVAMVACPIGSVRGYDQIVPHRVDLVNETKLYPAFDEGNDFEAVGMTRARKIFNKLHILLEEEGFSEQHTHQDGDVIVIQRHNPITHKAFYAACRTAYHKEGGSDRHITVKVPGKTVSVIGYYSLEIFSHQSPGNPNFISGLPSNLIEIHDPRELQKIFSVTTSQSSVDISEEYKFHHFPPGSVLLFEVQIPDKSTAAITELAKIDTDYSLFDCFQKINGTEFSYLFYSCESEELQKTEGKRGCYDIPNFGKLPYAGICGLVAVLNSIRKNNDMGHALFNNLRAGNWMLDFILDRLDNSRKYKGIHTWLKHYFQQVKNLPRHFIPKYLDKVVMKYYMTGVNYVCTSLMGSFISQNVDPFVEQLALSSFQFVGDYHLIDPALADFGSELRSSMAAGLPHFSTGFMRVWGRDTFISLRGLLLVTGRWKEARDLLLGFASALRHGLIPNLLDSGRNPRYNARDATWWFLQALQEYCTMSPEGTKLLFENVPVLFPWDSYLPTETRSVHKKDLATIVQEIMQCHAKGIDFRERNAGPKIDDKMKDEGFNVKISMDPSTGFIHGGNQLNCGTWMDKMGESNSAGNYGIPATPRDGADIEIIGLLKSTTRWLSKLNKERLFPHKGVKISVNPLYPDETCILSYTEWDLAIQQNFELKFYIPIDASDDKKFTIDKKLVNRRGIYKDTVGSKTEWADYQLRPNQCIAMTVAPELFKREHAVLAIQTIEKTLLGPLGMKTLDPSDWNYRPNYDNSSDNTDYKTSRGFNYHQGPEWVWCYGYFLRAKILFDFPPGTPTLFIRNSIHQLLLPHRQHIKEDKWQGLPELTNENGKLCYFSCPTQAWSCATILDALYDLHNLVYKNNNK